MQVAALDGLDKRVLYYASKSYAAQINRGNLYRQLNPTFFIGILDFKITKNQAYISRHKVVDIQTGEHYIKDIAFNFIELPKFNKPANKLKTIIDQWVYFIKNAENLALIPERTTDEGLKKAYENADKHNWTEKELDAYDKIFMQEQDDRGRMNFAIRKAKEEAVQITEKKTQNKIGANFLKADISIKTVAENTGLTFEEVKNLLHKS